jgi:aspartate/methionine/tyrosine aminotransferase
MMRATRPVACAFLSRSTASTSSLATTTERNTMPCFQSIYKSRLLNSKIPTIVTKTATFASSSSSSNADDNLLSSTRGRNAVSLLPVYLTDARSVTKYHPTEAPDGSLQLSVAENQMLEDLLVPALRKFSSASNSSNGMEGLFYSDQIYYQPTHGREGLRTAMSQYLQRILKLPEGKCLDLDGMVLGAGCNAVLENLCFCLTEPGDAVLLPTLYYAAFEFDLAARAALKIVPVKTMEFQSGIGVSDGTISQAMYYPNRKSLDAAYAKAVEGGSKPKILLLSHPNNPLGVCYPPSVVKECIDWAREKQVHLVSDEIYAGSVYNQVNEETGEDAFHSALTLASTENSSENGLGLGPYIHFVYALSKDFALSGLRVGVAYSENEEIRLPMQKLNDLCQISSQTQLTVEKMLSSASDDGQLWSSDVFLPENNGRIKSRSNMLQSVLDESGIPFLRGDSGLFLWMDFSEFLPTLADGESEGLAESQDSMNTRERTLYLELVKKFGLLFTPGMSMRNELPGFFRCVFTAASDEEFALGLERIKIFVSAKRS